MNSTQPTNLNLPMKSDPAQPEAPTSPATKLNREFRQRIDSCKAYRRQLISKWALSIDYRRGKPFASQSDDDQVAVNLDWILTKSKQASLFSQVPEVRLEHDVDLSPTATPWASKFARKLNDALIDAGVESTMDECLPDCINAAGIGVALVAYESLMEDRQIPSIDTSSLPPEILSQVLQSGQLGGEDIPMEVVPHTIAHRYTVQRISPADFLFPLEFTGSNFDNGPWIGRTGRIPWAEAVQRFKLNPEDKDKILGEDKPIQDRLTHDMEKDHIGPNQMVAYEEIFYKDYLYDPTAKSYESIHHLVFIVGKDEPVIDEPWKGQQVQEDGTVIGARRFPIRVLTLSYITDDTIPPSDSAIGRPQVNELNRARTQMIQQRQRSLPIRGVDVNRMDPTVLQSMMRGTWQQFIPVQGDASKVITEISRAAMPQENFMFDKIAKTDLLDEWGMDQTVGPDMGHGMDPNQNKSNFNSRIGRDRAKVASFFVGIAEVLGGLMCICEDPSSFGQGFDPSFSRALRYSILADSTVLLDAGQKLARINQFINLYAKSGWVNLEPVLQEAATLTGLDASAVIRAPQPKPPVEPNISLRLTGVEDLLNPLALAFMIKSGQAPPPELIEQAKSLIQQAVVPPQGMQMPGQAQPIGGFPMLPQGADPNGGGAPTPQGASLPPPVQGPPHGAPMPSPPPPKTGEAHPAMSAMPQVNQRSQSGGKQ